MRQKGVALVLVLWIVTLLSIMAGSFALSMRRESSIMFGLKSVAQAQAYAEAGIAMAQMMMLQSDPLKRWQADGQIYEFRFDRALIRVQMLAESGKVDLNQADLKLLQRVLSQAPIEAEKQARIADAIIDWRDKDDTAREDGAEKREYKKAGLKYVPRNEAFQSLEELQMVLGMDSELYDWLEPFITIHSGKSGVDLKKASAELRLILEDEDEKRTGAGLRKTPSRSVPVTPVDEQSEGDFDMPETGEEQDNSSNTDVLTIVSEAMIDEEITATVHALVKRVDEGSAPFSIVQWRPKYTKARSLFAVEMENY
ncbi:general secretion pathway protein GspK [Methylicorpusculum sp.]|uniref:general secretion pathway protein GspK n=1 Tax=Methylicorpusculum sp. TaxID=2713644 RepID=UPI0027170DD3|nr:type II secretion system protein GspK [Methylicorpusculum sp.]MDO8845398.1 type II secretion system protein GspK [Methylicorpusculum sp.]MDP2179582.1 type II secretion system protein GspK [Methylicorpusculum sp.]MDP3531620.1 type II secretion system protein GspK [Methylicorpusculum sp.]MDZ4153017.1 type II secretion system protein GspK [Methylicorpusculum sp.]